MKCPTCQGKRYVTAPDGERFECWRCSGDGDLPDTPASLRRDAAASRVLGLDELVTRLLARAHALEKEDN